MEEHDRKYSLLDSLVFFIATTPEGYAVSILLLAAGEGISDEDLSPGTAERFEDVDEIAER